MVNRGSDNLCNVFIVDGVVDHFTVFAVFDDARCPQYPQLMGNSRLGQGNSLRDILNAQFTSQQGGDELYVHN